MIRKIGLISRTYRHIKRYRKIITVLIKHGFGDLVNETNLYKYIDLGKKFIPWKTDKKTEYLSRWERIRKVLEELGPTFIKFGQIMSNRPDLLPKELIYELEKLQDSVPQFSGEDAQKLVEEELGKPISEIFMKFEISPIASASISQVHRAELIDGEGEEVAVKIQRPGIEHIIEVDLEIMLHFATLIEKYIKGMDILSPINVIKEFEKSIKKEIDFTIEATNIDRFGRNFQDDMTIYVPKVYRDYSTKKILTMEYIDGIKVSNIDTILKSDSDPKVIGSRSADLIIKQIFEHGFFHADPHPGNILILNNNTICFLDFGMMGICPPKHKEYLSSIIVGFVKKDASIITKALMKFTYTDKIKEIDQLEYQISELIEQYSYIPLKDLDMGDCLNKLIKLILEYKLKMPPDIYLLLKALITIEGVGRKLDPDFNAVKHVEPFAKKLLKERMSPIKLLKDIHLSLIEFAILLRDFPSEIREIITKIKHGELNVKFEHKGLEPMLKTHSQISNRISFAIVLASLIIGSSLIILSGIPPKWNDIPIVGIIGFFGGGIMGFWLLISILRHGKM